MSWILKPSCFICGKRISWLSIICLEPCKPLRGEGSAAEKQILVETATKTQLIES